MLPNILWLLSRTLTWNCDMETRTAHSTHRLDTSVLNIAEIFFFDFLVILCLMHYEIWFALLAAKICYRLMLSLLQSSQVPFCWTAFQLLFFQSVLLSSITPSQVQNLACYFLKPLTVLLLITKCCYLLKSLCKALHPSKESKTPLSLV